MLLIRRSWATNAKNDASFLLLIAYLYREITGLICRNRENLVEKRLIYRYISPNRFTMKCWRISHAVTEKCLTTATRWHHAFPKYLLSMDVFVPEQVYRIDIPSPSPSKYVTVKRRFIVPPIRLLIYLVTAKNGTAILLVCPSRKEWILPRGHWLYVIVLMCADEYRSTVVDHIFSAMPRFLQNVIETLSIYRWRATLSSSR